MPRPGILDGLGVNTESEEATAIRALFPHEDKYRRLQMITELQPRAVVPMSVLGVIRRKFKSKILAIFQEEYNLNQIARERKGRLELSEVVAAVRRPKEQEGD